jgi:transcriptional regulator
MLDQPEHRLSDIGVIRQVIDRNAWAYLSSAAGDDAPVVSPLPVLLDPEDPDGVTILTHIAAADAVLHDLGRRRVVIVVNGPHGYISPTFYVGGPYVPTWNFVTVQLSGVPEVLDGATTFDILSATVDHFERDREQPWSLQAVDGYAHRIAPGATGFRLRPDKIRAKAKLNQDKPAVDIDSVITHLRTDDVHGNAALADIMDLLVRPAP